MYKSKKWHSKKYLLGKICKDIKIHKNINKYMDKTNNLGPAVWSALSKYLVFFIYYSLTTTTYRQLFF